MTAYAMPKTGEIIAGKYRLDKVAGEGGMGIVYVAEHLVLKQRVAVKILLPEAAKSEAMVERFAREARAAAKINSEHVARVLDAGSLANGAPFLVMEYLEGCDLEELLDLQDALPVREVIDYLIQALEGLAHAHAAGIVHRDLKPANLFLACRPDGTNAIKVLDFGISKTKKTLTPEDKRLTGQFVLGSPVYMSPEQLRNAPDIDPRADLWSIGVVAYEMFTGTTPFDGDGVGEIFAAILEKSPVPLSEKNPKIAEDLGNVIGKCLRRDPAERWSDAADLARALAPFGSDPDTPLVARAEQVLARARLSSTLETPLDTQRVVDAIDAAAKRALTTASDKTSPALPLSKLKEKEDPKRVSMMSYARRSPRRIAAAAGLVAFLGISMAYAIHRTRPAPPEVARASVVEEAPLVAPTSESSQAAPESEPPLVMDLPPSSTTPRTPLRRPTTTSAKPVRPKFLNSRE